MTLALILAFVPFPGSTFVARLIDTFIALPTFLVTLAFTFLYGSAGMLNGALAQSFGTRRMPVTCRAGIRGSRPTTAVFAMGRDSEAFANYRSFDPVFITPVRKNVCDT